MAHIGMYIRAWIYLCAVTKTVYPLVNMELQVLQFDNPLGTSYTRDNLNSGRKCCDAGGSDCRSNSDKCDVYFVFCFGRYDLKHPGCDGASIDMQQDVSTDVLKITKSENKKLFRTFNVTNWNTTEVIVQVLDIDMIPTGSVNHPHAFTDLIDSFEKTLDFSPASNYWEAEDHVISLVKHTSLDILLRAWCAPGWYGKWCNQSDCQADDVHECTTSGRRLNIECTDPDILVLNFNSPVKTLSNRVLLKENIITFLANEVCAPSTNQINVTIKELREKSDGGVDVIFTGFCDTSRISNLKVAETVFVMNQVRTRLTPVGDIFGANVTSPGIKFVKGDQTNIILVLRIVNYVNLGSHGCTTNNSSGLCDPRFLVSFSWTSTSYAETVSKSGNLTDCNGKLIDVESADDDNAKVSTLLFVLPSPSSLSSESMVIKITNTRSSQTVATHTITLANLHPGSIFYDAQPYRFPTSFKNNTRLTVEAVAWCANCRTGQICQSKHSAPCDPSITVVSPSCQHSTDCMNGGTCVGETCHCNKGWTGPKCNVDIDECAMGVCTHAQSCTNTRGGYSCTCAAGFTGNDCEADIDECSTLPCNTGLICLNTFGSYACVGVCTNNDVGPNCTGAVDFCVEQPCRNGSTCVSGALNFTCQCAAGWSGSLCKTNVNECENATLCQNGGTCRDNLGSFQCLCPETYMGTFCEDDVDECLAQICKNNATCTNKDGGFSCQCTSGYTGKTCSNDINECMNNPCVHSENCTNLIGDYSCGKCYMGWEGKNCDIDRDECLASSLCANNGNCINTEGSYQCNCTEQWTGRHCHKDVDECANKYACNYHGKCNNTDGSFHCSCYTGWDGDTCDEDVDECLNSPCKNGGLCNNTEGSFVCDCTNAWKGDTCETHVDECSLFVPCKNGGTCNNTDTHYTCSCPSNWVGENCTDDVDECLNGDVCSHGGTCINNEGSFQCECPTQWTNATCNTDVNECLQQPCKNNGFCRNLPGNYTCDCTSAWTGPNCTTNVDECIVYHDICNHGVCNDTEGGFSCTCLPGYQGDDCSTDVNECNKHICQNGGSCVNIEGSYICHCPKEWTGLNCEQDYNECNDNPCLHGGKCSNMNGSFTCQCILGRTGRTCEQDIDECARAMCEHGASCNNTVGSFVCTCAKGYEGKTCSVNTNDCINVSCEHGGICQDLIADFKCKCATGYTGTYCENDIDDCNPNPCHNGGKCHDHIGYYECVCTPGWQGKLCYTDVDECKSNTSPCNHGEACTNTIGSYTCKADFFASTLPSTRATTAALNVDVFSLQFTSPVQEQQWSTVQNGITRILKLLDCHDSSYIHVSLVHNSMAKPNVVEFYAQCDGHHLTNEEVNTAIRTLSQNKLEDYFPNMQLADVQAKPEKQDEDWVSSHIVIIGGAAGGAVVLVIVITIIVCLKRKKTSDDEDHPYSGIGVDVIQDMDGTETLTIRNPVYESMYKPESIS